MTRRYRTSNAQKKGKRAANKKDFALMVTAASDVVIHNRGKNEQYRGAKNPAYVLFTFPHWVKFSSGFPKGRIVSKTLLTNTYKINAVKLLDWLYANGHSEYDAATLVKETKQVETLFNQFDKLFEGD